MTIYDVKFYGVYYRYKLETSGVNIYAKKEEALAVPGFENLFFEVSALKEYLGKENVLKIEFEDGTCEYETMFYPFLYLDDGVWRNSGNTSTKDAFLTQYFKYVEKNN